jgi:hypothetical protein
MTWSGIGEFTLGGCVPMALTAQGGLSASVGLVLPEMQARIAGYIEAQAAVILHPITIASQLASAVALVAQLEALIAVGIPLVSLDTALIAGLIAELQATIGTLEARATFAVNLGVLLGTPGVYLVRHSGPVGDVLPAGLPGGSGPSQPVQGIAILATDAGAWSAIEAMFRVE